MTYLQTPLLTEAEYATLCHKHDWHFEQSSDQRVWRKGWAERRALQAAQPLYDKIGLIWNKCAPSDLQLQFGACRKCDSILFRGWRCPVCNPQVPSLFTPKGQA